LVIEGVPQGSQSPGPVDRSICCTKNLGLAQVLVHHQFTN
jgi:hypothetical protein